MMPMAAGLEFCCCVELKESQAAACCRVSRVWNEQPVWFSVQCAAAATFVRAAYQPATADIRDCAYSMIQYSAGSSPLQRSLAAWKFTQFAVQHCTWARDFRYVRLPSNQAFNDDNLADKSNIQASFETEAKCAGGGGGGCGSLPKLKFP